MLIIAGQSVGLSTSGFMSNCDDQCSFFSLFRLFDLVKPAPLNASGYQNYDNTQIERTRSNFYPRKKISVDIDIQKHVE